MAGHAKKFSWLNLDDRSSAHPFLRWPVAPLPPAGTAHTTQTGRPLTLPPRLRRLPRSAGVAGRRERCLDGTEEKARSSCPGWCAAGDSHARWRGAPGVFTVFTMVRGPGGGAAVCTAGEARGRTGQSPVSGAFLASANGDVKTSTKCKSGAAGRLGDGWGVHVRAHWSVDARVRCMQTAKLLYRLVQE